MRFIVTLNLSEIIGLLCIAVVIFIYLIFFVIYMFGSFKNKIMLRKEQRRNGKRKEN